MSKHKAPCQACRTPVFDMMRRFDRSLGYVCPECFEFSNYADKALRKHGIEGSVIDRADSSTPKTP